MSLRKTIVPLESPGPGIHTLTSVVKPDLVSFARMVLPNPKATSETPIVKMLKRATLLLPLTSRMWS